MVTFNILEDWLRHPEKLDRDTLYQIRTMVERYPYFSLLHLLLLKNMYLLQDSDFNNELWKSAIYISDRRKLFWLLEGEHFKLRSERENIESEAVNNKVDNIFSDINRTVSLIDHYLEVEPQHTKIKESAPANYATDYAAYLLQQEESDALVQVAEGETDATESHGDKLIDNFINNSDGKFNLNSEDLNTLEKDAPVGPNTDYTLDDDSYFTETLAKIYIKQKKYDKAIEIIRKLNLRNPKKSVYFADQIRFLEKLVINENKKK